MKVIFQDCVISEGRYGVFIIYSVTSMLNRNSVVLLAMGIFPVCCFSSCTDPEISEKDWFAKFEKNIDGGIKVLKNCKKDNIRETSQKLRALSANWVILQEELQYVRYDSTMDERRSKCGKKIEKLMKRADDWEKKIVAQNIKSIELGSAVVEYFTELAMCVDAYSDFVKKKH